MVSPQSIRQRRTAQSIGGRERRRRQSDERVRVESYTLRGERCVYDLLFVAEPQAFDAGRGDFRRFVESFSGE